MTFTIYSKPACPACDQAKAFLTSRNLPFEVISLDVGQPKKEGEKYISRDELLARVPGARTVPQIFQEDRLIGGFNELRSIVQ